MEKLYKELQIIIDYYRISMYQKGKIYKLISNLTDKIYIGSTVANSLCTRHSQHIQDYIVWQKGKTNYVSSFELVKLQDCKIILIEAFSCNSKDELRQREQYWIDLHKDICVNRISAFGMDKEKRLASQNKFNQNHPNAGKEKAAKYRQKNNESYICECGSTCKKLEKYRHIKSNKHLNYLKLN